MSFTIYTGIVQRYYIRCDRCEKVAHTWPNDYTPTVDEIVAAGKHHDAIVHPTEVPA